MKNKLSPKKIHIIVNYFYPVTAGVETNILETYSHLMKKGYAIIVHASTDTLEEKNKLPLLGSVRGIRIIRYPFRRFFGFFPYNAFETGSMVCLHNFDVSPYIFLLFYAWAQKQLLKKRYTLIFSPHGALNPNLSLFPKWQRLIRWACYRWPTVSLINSVVDGVRAVSDWEKERLIKIGIKPTLIRVITNGLQDEAFINPDKKASKQIKKTVKKIGMYIIQIGRIANQKNFETSIRALSMLPKNISFVIVGPTHDRRYKFWLQSLAKRLGLERRVIFLGVVRGTDKYYLIKKAEMMVHMAAWESFCNAVHEGMSQGLVCVVANNTALPYLVKHDVNGYCLPTYDHKSVAEKIMFILNNKNSNITQKIKKNNIQSTSLSSWKNVSTNMETYYGHIVNNSLQNTLNV